MPIRAILDCVLVGIAAVRASDNQLKNWAESFRHGAPQQHEPVMLNDLSPGNQPPQLSNAAPHDASNWRSDVAVAQSCGIPRTRCLISKRTTKPMRLADG
jgi:hypothetical protein